MADFMSTIKALPPMKALGDANAVEGLVEEAILYLYGIHRWPFLKQVDFPLTWTAGQPTKAFDGLARITTIRFPDSTSSLRPLIPKADADFARYKYNNAANSQVSIWRDAGMQGTNMVVELFGVPTTNAALKADVFLIPAVADVNGLPGYFKRLIRNVALADVPGSGVSLIQVDYMAREAVARSEDMAGTLEYAQMDDFSKGRMDEVNNPT